MQSVKIILAGSPVDATPQARQKAYVACAEERLRREKIMIDAADAKRSATEAFKLAYELWDESRAACDEACGRLPTEEELENELCSQ